MSPTITSPRVDYEELVQADRIHGSVHFDPRVYAIGECVAHRGATYGLVAPLFEMAKVCANHLAGYGIARYAGSQVSTKQAGMLAGSATNVVQAQDTARSTGTPTVVPSSITPSSEILANPDVRRVYLGDRFDG